MPCYSASRFLQGSRSVLTLRRGSIARHSHPLKRYLHVTCANASAAIARQARVQIVDLKDTYGYAVLNGKPYQDLYRDIRGAVDLCHRDGSLKTEVAAHPGKYIHKVRARAHSARTPGMVHSAKGASVLVGAVIVCVKQKLFAFPARICKVRAHCGDLRFPVTYPYKVSRRATS